MDLEPGRYGDERSCVGCGATFVARRWDQRSCGLRPCASEAMRLGKVKVEPTPPREKVVLAVRACDECGTEYQPVRPNHVYCSKRCTDYVSMRRFKQREDFPKRREEYNARYRVRHGDAIDERNRRWMQAKRFAVFGATVEDYDRLSAEQGGRCATCGRFPNLLVFDHDHATNTPRGLLCQPCNLALGYVRDSERTLARMTEYLRTYRSADTDT